MQSLSALVQRYRKERGTPPKSSPDEAPSASACPTCSGTGWIAVRRPDSLSTEAALCPDCRAPEWQRTLNDRLVSHCGLTDEELQRSTFDGWIIARPGEPASIRERRAEMIAAARTFVAGDTAAWSLAYLGGNGTGKSRLVCAIVGAVISRGEQVRYVSCPDLFDDLRELVAASKRADRDADAEPPAQTPDGLIADLAALPWLVLDELPHRDALNDWRGDFLDRLVNRRYRANLRTVAASNHPIDHLPPRVASRLSAGLVIPTHTLPDWRAS